MELLQIAFRPSLEGKDDVHALKNIIAGALRATSDAEKRTRIIKAASAGLSEVQMVGLLVLGPYT